ncbi:unnamed protein product [Sphagnum tenellum]
MSKLVANIAASLDIRPATNEALEGVDPLTIITASDWFILKDFVVMHIQDQGSWVQAERDSNNNARELEAPPFMPADHVKIRLAAFIQDVLDPYRAHLSKHWSQQ